MLTQEEEKEVAGAEPVTPGRPRTLLARLPDLAAVAVTGFAVPAMVLLLLGRFVQPLVLALGLAGALAATVVVLRTADPAPPRDRTWTVAALLLAAAFFLVNATWSAQNIYATRDPATYSLAGQWLAHHHDVMVPAGDDVFGTAPGLTPASPGFRTDAVRAGYVYAQGNHLLPALLGVASWMAGPRALFRTNALIGALALLAAFGLVRRFAGGGFALMAAAALAVSMPMLAFSRDTYTEPLTLLLLLGGLSLLWRAVEAERPAYFLLAGLTLGSSTMARIDGYAALFAVVVVAAGLLVAAPGGRRRAALGRVGLLLTGAVAAAALGFADVSSLSSGYYQHLRSEVLGMIVAAGALAVIAAAAVAVAWATPLARRLLAARWRRVWATVAAGGVVVVFAVLATRPFWLVSRGECYAGVGALQRYSGRAVDPCRSYDEYTLSWIAWYYGWPLVVAAVLGLALLTRRAVRDSDVRLLGVVAAVLAISALYLVRASIVPDQVWAMRRFLSLVIPGMLAGAAYLLHTLARRGRVAAVAATALAAVFVLTAAVITHPMERVRTGVGQFAQVQAVCAALPENAAVLSLGTSAIGSYVQTMRSFCDVPAQAMADTSGAALAQVYANAHRRGRTLYVIAEKSDAVPYRPDVRDPAPFFTAHTTKWPEVLVSVPQWRVSYDVPLYLGTVEPTGLVRPVPPAP